jgi:hypothetical protein
MRGLHAHSSTPAERQLSVPGRGISELSARYKRAKERGEVDIIAVISQGDSIKPYEIARDLDDERVRKVLAEIAERLDVYDPSS